MRKTPLRRKSRLRAKKGLKRTGRIKAVNPARKRKRRARDFGDKADFIRDQPCDTCQAPPPNDPSHYPSRGAGGTKRDLFPQCRECHEKMSAPGWGVETLLESIGRTKGWLGRRTDYWERKWREIDSS